MRLTVGGTWGRDRLRMPKPWPDALGNAVVPQSGALAIRTALDAAALRLVG